MWDLYVVFGLFIIGMIVWGYFLIKESREQYEELKRLNPPWLEEEEEHDK